MPDSTLPIDATGPAADTPAPAGQPRRLPSILYRLAILVVACVLPAGAVSAYLIYDHYQVERALLLGEALSTTRSMMAVVDRDFDTVTTALRTLAASSDMERDLDAFKLQAMNVHAILPIADLALVDPLSGRQLLNTMASSARQAPFQTDPALLARVLKQGQPAVSDLYLPPGGRPFVTIGVPVFRRGVIARVLTATIEPGSLANVLTEQKLSTKWRVSITDSQGAIVARNTDIAHYLGIKVHDDLYRRMQGQPEGHLDTHSLDGVPVVTIYSRSPRSGWSVALGIPQRNLSAGLLRTLESLILSTVVLLTVGLGLAWLVGRRVARSIQALIGPATALGTGAMIEMPRLDFREADQVATSLRQAALALQQAKQAAASEMAERRGAQAALMAADARKDEFLATLAHELRNPMAPLVNALEILRMQEARRGGADKVLDIMERQLKQMVRLIDDLLDVSRIATNKLSIKNEDLRLQDVLAYSQETVAPLLAQRGHQLTVALPERPLPVRGDATRLAQLFSNLLNNAAKYTAPGGAISLTAAVTEGAIEVVIGDSGIGMTPAVLDQVFEIFYQADQTLGRSQAGLGIGLPLARRLAELHGGKLRASSPGDGMGSTFTVTLPLADAAAAAPSVATAPAANRTSHRVLLADDNIDHATTLSTLLSAAGQQVEVCHDGASALLAAAGFLPQFAFLDIGMPGLDGYQLAGRLRADPRTAACVLVAVTGWGQEKDQLRSRQAGFDFHIVKPVRMAQLHAILDAGPRPGIPIP